ncbi:MAG: hypothetical protein P4M15_11400 [Alphaproteobacteria bacterium]|nr:hypothetical protein [Alphaproteobacteria bacterium]
MTMNYYGLMARSHKAINAFRTYGNVVLALGFATVDITSPVAEPGSGTTYPAPPAVSAQEPNLADAEMQVKICIASTLGVSPDSISIERKPPLSIPGGKITDITADIKDSAIRETKLITTAVTTSRAGFAAVPYKEVTFTKAVTLLYTLRNGDVVISKTEDDGPQNKTMITEERRLNAQNTNDLPNALSASPPQYPNVAQMVTDEALKRTQAVICMNRLPQEVPQTPAGDIRLAAGTPNAQPR